MSGKAPVLAWILMALTCLLTGMAIVESRHQAVVLPVWAPIVLAETAVAAATPPTMPELTQTPIPESTSTPILGPGEHLAPSRALLSEEALVGLATGTADLRLERLTVPPGTGLPPEVTPGPTVLLVEAGSLVVLVDGGAHVGEGLDAAQSRTSVPPGQRLVIAAGDRYIVRNDGATPAVALVVTVLPADNLGAAAAPRRSVTGWCRGC